eukprot:scaffold180904_cov27-Tisochrysis_lutea.AAC.2
MQLRSRCCGIDCTRGPNTELKRALKSLGQWHPDCDEGGWLRSGRYMGRGLSLAMTCALHWTPRNCNARGCVACALVHACVPPGHPPAFPLCNTTFP